MRLSYQHGYIFLANPKCGSQSVRRGLNQYSDVRSGGEGPGGELHNHSCLRTVEDFLQTQERSLDDFVVLTTCRNPWDRVVSCFEFGRQQPKSIWHTAFTEAGGDFRAFCNHRILRHHFAKDAKHAQGPYDILSFGSDRSGKMRAEVFDITNMQGLQQRFRQLGVPMQILHSNRSKRGSYADYYDDYSRRLVAELFSTDIDYMGYTY